MPLLPLQLRLCCYYADIFIAAMILPLRYAAMPYAFAIDDALMPMLSLIDDYFLSLLMLLTLLLIRHYASHFSPLIRLSSFITFCRFSLPHYCLLIITLSAFITLP